MDLSDPTHSYPSQPGVFRSSERGIALLLAIFVVALASILVVDLAYTSYLGSRLSSITTKSLQAEYLLKSAVNFARTLIKEDTSPEDAPQDNWASFIAGQVVPMNLLGIDTPGVTVSIEITPEEAKFPLRSILTRNGGEVDVKWRDAAMRLFQKLGFDDDLTEVDQTKLFPEKHFKSDELVAVLIDYMDTDKDSYEDQTGGFTRGFEGELAEEVFANERLKRIGELANIPGFTPARLRKLSPLVTVFGRGVLNINLASSVILESLHEDIDKSQAEAIVNFRNSQPFDDNNRRDELTNIIGEETYNAISSMLDIRSRWFQVLAKVDYGTSTYFMRAYLSKADEGELPIIRSVELFY